MRNLKRVLSLALALVMVLGMMVVTTSAATYTDADEITNVEAVEVLTALGIVQGDGTGFNPNGTFTREAAAKLLTYMKIGPDMAEKLAGTDVFTDVAANRWSAKYIGYCANLGYITGVGDGKFNPDGVLKDIELGKLVLCALGYDPAKYTGDNWATAVTVDMIDAGLVKNVTGSTISREDAAQMVLNGLKKGNDVVTYDVTVGGKTVSFDNQNDALLYCAINPSATFEGKVITTTGSLLSKVYNVTASVGTDAFGRTANTYAKAGWTAPMVYTTETAVKVYTDKAFGTTVTKNVVNDLKGYKAGTYEIGKDVEMAAVVADLVWTDGVKGALAIPTSKNVADAIADLTGDFKTVEIYANAKKEITKIVVVETYVDTIASVTDADAAKDIKASVALTGGLTFETAGYAVGDVVLYTKAAGAIKTMAAAPSFTGKLTQFTSDGEYTIDGKVYETKFAGGPSIGAAQLNKDFVYFTGNNDKIVAVAAAKGSEVATAGYAIVTNAAAKDTKDIFGNVTNLVAQVEVILSDGTKAVYDLALTKKDDGKYYAKINGADTEITTSLAASALTGVYTYTTDGTAISLVKKVAAIGTATDKTAVETGTNAAAITKASTSMTVGGKTVLANEKTVFIVKNALTNKLMVKTGIAALENTSIAAGADVVVNANYNAKTKTYTYIASVVFAETDNFAAASATVGVNDYVYVDGTYVVTKDAKGNEVYTATGYKADGTTIALTKGNVVEGIYKFNSKGEITGSSVATKATVGVIAGTTVELGSGNYVTVNDTTKVVVIAKNAALAPKAEVHYFDTSAGGSADGIIELVFVTKAAQ